MRSARIAVIPGDGIGAEVMPEGVRVLRTAADRFGIKITTEEFDFACAQYYRAHGVMMPDNWADLIGHCDAILFGAAGWPEVVPDHVSLWGSLLRIRREFDQYVNLRPCRLLPGVTGPLRDWAAGDIDFVVVRENSEGEYSPVGGVMFAGTEREVVIQESVMTRTGADRILDFAFTLASSPARRRHVTGATKSNGIPISMVWWDERFRATAARFADVRSDLCHVDALAAKVVLRPDQFDVIVATNLFGDILSDLASMLTGSLGMLPSATLGAPDAMGRRHALYEPIHGSAPDIAGKGQANPLAQMLSFAMLLRFSFEMEEDAALIERACTNVLASGLRTADVMAPGCAKVGTHVMGEAVVRELDKLSA
jgi:tartrate dehydrogenase/decarboxylase/D-malate dehydrogenase